MPFGNKPQRFLVVAAMLISPLAHAVDWPDFRGPSHDGHVTKSGESIGLPTTWSEAEKVKWKTAIPHKGWSTPAAMDGKIWLTTATEDGHEYFGIAVDAESGQVLWNEKLFHCDNPDPLDNGVNCYASPSPVMEKGRAYLNFGRYGTACIDTADYKVIWKRDDMPCNHWRGPGSSPMLWEDLLILTFDGADLQYLIALNKATGETVWKTDRTTAWRDLDENGNMTAGGDLRKGFSTPYVAEANGKQYLISPGSMECFAYDPRTGKELWKFPMIGHTPAPRPVAADGIAYILNGRAGTEMYAVRIEGEGNIESNILWKSNEPLLPQEPSPILLDGHLYTLSNSGVVTCFNAKDGAQIWSERIGGNFVASPIYADGHLYCSSVNGKTHVVKTGPAFEEVAENELDDGFMASPAVYGKALILRTKTHLYRIEE